MLNLFYLLKVGKVLLNLYEARRLLVQFALQSYLIYVLLYVGSATVQTLRWHCYFANGMRRSTIITGNTWWHVPLKHE